MSNTAQRRKEQRERRRKRIKAMAQKRIDRLLAQILFGIGRDATTTS